MNDRMSNSWWNISLENILRSLHVDPQKGLSDNQVKEYRSQFGSNIIVATKPISLITLLLEGIKEPMMLLLLSIALLSLLFGKFIESFAMICVVLAYIGVELINKYRTDRIMTRLKQLSLPTSKVIRNGTAIEIPTTDIVVGDVIILSEGVLVPADARLLTSHGLIVNEASLTGESVPVEKNVQEKVEEHAALADRINSIFSGTTILDGQGTAIVVAVGTRSQLGKIAQQVQKTHKEQTILQQSMTRLAKILALFAFAASALIPTIGFLRGLSLQEMILTWLSLTFLMIPGQPPIIITMALALASFALAKKQVIVKRLRGIEIMAQVTSVVSDKTGTITESTMVLEAWYTRDGMVEQLPQDLQEDIALALPDYGNDPTDRAVFDALDNTTKKYHQIDFSGFADHKPWRDLVYQKNGILLHAIAGSPELLIFQSQLSSDQQKIVRDIVEKETAQGKRVTAYASVENRIKQLDELYDLSFLALAILKDPVRAGVKDAIKELEQAKVATYIVTGDHKETAQAIATEIGISGHVLTGKEFDKLSDRDIVAQIEQSYIFARMDPSQKMRLVKLLQERDETVAVIGDGVNDAPALKAAHVGIAMGQIGTDLAKEVSDLILTDDNYVHIPDAITIARTALDNFRKGLAYYLSAKLILLLVFLVPLFLAIPFPFVPIQIILIELLMDLASSTIFVMEQTEPDVMKKPAQKMTHFLGMPLAVKILKNSLPLAVGITLLYLITCKQYEITVAQTAAFVSWLIGHILLAINLKQEKVPLIRQGLFSNYFALVWLCSMIALSIIITCIPMLYPYLKTAWLPVVVWGEIIMMVIITTFWIELVKLMRYEK